VTLATGTSASCRTPLLRNQATTGNLPVEFTIRNPQAGFMWSTQRPGAPLNPMTTTPGNGAATAAGPIAVVGSFNDIGTPLATGLQFTTVLRLYTLDSFSGTTRLSMCEIAVFGEVPRS
jgi:hypothetical protein